MNSSGVVAGTLVHTKEGLKPIETIQVGDYVLSKPENGEGETAYKRVTQTFKHENRELFAVVYGVKGVGYLISTTAEHPFWVPSVCVSDPNKKFGGMEVPHGKWVSAEEMYIERDVSYKGNADFLHHNLLTFDGEECPAEVTPICTATNYSKDNLRGDYGSDFGVVWPIGGSGYEGAMRGRGVDFRESPPLYQSKTIGLDKKAAIKIRPAGKKALLSIIPRAANLSWQRCIT